MGSSPEWERVMFLAGWSNIRMMTRLCTWSSLRCWVCTNISSWISRSLSRQNFTDPLSLTFVIQTNQKWELYRFPWSWRVIPISLRSRSLKWWSSRCCLRRVFQAFLTFLIPARTKTQMFFKTSLSPDLLVLLPAMQFIRSQWAVMLPPVIRWLIGARTESR